MANGFEASLACEGFGGSAAAVVCDLNNGKLGGFLKALSESFSGWKVWEKMPLLVDFGCAVNKPACCFSTSAVFAGCGVLKPPVKRLGLLAAGASDVAGFGVASLSLLCVAPKRLSLGVVAAAGGFASVANGFALGVSAGAAAVCWEAVTLPNSEGLGVAAGSSGSLIALKGLLAGVAALSCACDFC